MKRKLKMKWSCSDYVRHEHKYKFTAWLCGRIQYLFARINKKPIPKPFIRWYIKYNGSMISIPDLEKIKYNTIDINKKPEE